MTELEFQQLAAQGYTRIPVLAEARADLYTPLALYVKLANGPYSYLLESVVGGERFGRYSFIGLPAPSASRRAAGRCGGCGAKGAPILAWSSSTTRTRSSTPAPG